MTPRYIITANGRPITDRIAPILESLTVTDETGFDSDRLSISLDDTSGNLELPTTGAEIGLQLGLGSILVDCGTFIVDTVSGDGPPSILRIECHAVPMTGNGHLQTRKSRSWDGLTLGEIVRTIANENGIEPVIAQNLEAIDPGHLDQTDESDLSFVARLARMFSAAPKFTAGRLAFIERGASRTASGASLPPITLTRGDVSRWQWTIAARGGYKTIIAKYRDLDAAATREIVVGDGEPVFRLPHTYSTSGNARRAAKAKLDDFTRSSGGQVQLSMPGRLDLIAETPVILAGLRQGIDGGYIVRRVAHTISGGGLTTTVDCERGLAETNHP